MERALADLEALESEYHAPGEAGYAARVAALDALDHVDELLRVSGRAGRSAFRRATALRRTLEGANQMLYDRLRDEIRAGGLSRAGLRRLLDAHTAYRASERRTLHLELEPADSLVDGILGFERFEGAPTLTHRDYVHLEDTPVRVLLDLADHVAIGPQDCICDLGSGLGRAAILLHLLTGAPAEGIEVQPEYCAYARAVAAGLGLQRVCFQQADARQADLSRGSVYYMFTPFKGRTLSDVLARLAGEAQRRPITVCTYGAVSLVVAQEPWLRPASGEEPHEFTLEIWRSR